MPEHPLTDTSFSEIVGFLERQYDDILAEESRIKRNPRFRDNRVHVLLYFITPTGHGYVFSRSGPPRCCKTLICVTLGCVNLTSSS